MTCSVPLVAGLAAALALALGALTGCSSTNAPTTAKEKAVAPTPAPVPLPGRVRAQRGLDVPQGGDFDFGAGRRVRASLPERNEEPTEATEPAARASRPAEAAAATTPPVAGRGIRVTWEALAVERDLVANPRLGRRPQRGLAPDLKIVLVSDTHPDAAGRQKGRAGAREADGSQMAVVAEQDMQLFVRGLREAGFFKLARPTDAVVPLFGDEEARGRVTVEVAGESRTLLSLRGQGMQDATKQVPLVYSQAKQAVAAVRNQTPTLSVLTTGGEPIKPRLSRGTGKGRTLTEEEAAAVLGGDLPQKPVDDNWGLGR